MAKEVGRKTRNVGQKGTAEIFFYNHFQILVRKKKPSDIAGIIIQECEK